MVFFGKITGEPGERVLGIVNREKVMQKIANEPEGFVEIILKHKKQRTSKQNRYLHGYLIPEFRKALVSVGYNEIKDDEQAKLVMKSLFLTRAIPNETGAAPVHYVQDTSTLSTEEMNSLFTDVIMFSAENLHYEIRYPGESLEFEF